MVVIILNIQSSSNSK